MCDGGCVRVNEEVVVKFETQVMTEALGRCVFGQNTAAAADAFAC